MLFSGNYLTNGDTATEVIESVIEENIRPDAIQEFLNDLPEKALSLGVRIVLAILVFVIGRFLIKMVRKIVKRSLSRIGSEQSLINFLDSLVKTILYTILILVIASQFGMDAASVVAVVGSAGVAIGLAVQGSLSNFAGGVLILLLKPFRVGDYIYEDSHGNEGTVEEIQLFYTKLKTLDQKIVVLPNGALANTSLTNATAASHRMLLLKVGISYDADMKLAKSIITDVLKKDEAVDQDRDIIAYVDELGDSAVVIGARCYVPTEYYWTCKWRVTEEIKSRFDTAGVTIPFNQLDVHIAEK